jgi:hypothetical protein
MQTPSLTQNTQEMNNLQNFLDSSVASYLATLRETERMFKEKHIEFDRFLTEKFAETDRQIKKNDRIIMKKFAETDRRMKETDRQMKGLQQLVGGIGNNNGDMAEEYFFNAFKKNKTFANQTFDKVLRNKWIDTDDWKAEFDLLLLNGKSAVIIEVKYKADYNIKIQKLVSRVRPFKALFPEYKSHNIYLGVAAMSFNKYLVQELRETGIATIHQVGNKMVVYDQELKVF